VHLIAPTSGEYTGAIATTGPITYYDRHFDIQAAKLLPGEYHVATTDTLLVTVLGSCVSACIRDPHLRIGGMNHFMLPEQGINGPAGLSARYGVYAMEVLINELLKHGARRERLEAKIFGGACVVAGMTHANIGERNAAFVLDFLRTERIAVAAQDLLDIHPRKVYYFPHTGRALVKRLFDLHNDTIAQRERDYRSRLRANEMGGEIELFG
jgi:chemotaxis protein CheD